jgi:hypothetical protein
MNVATDVMLVPRCNEIINNSGRISRIISLGGNFANLYFKFHGMAASLFYHGSCAHLCHSPLRIPTVMFMSVTWQLQAYLYILCWCLVSDIASVVSCILIFRRTLQIGSFTGK